MTYAHAAPARSSSAARGRLRKRRTELLHRGSLDNCHLCGRFSFLTIRDPETCRTPGDCGIPAIPSLPQRDRLSRTSMSSASLARSAASVSITSSSSMSVTCAVFCRHIFRILTKPERIARSTRITTRRVQYTRQPLARSLRSRRPVVCIIATNAPLHELLGRPKCHVCFRRRPFPLSNCVAQM
jgi:hypothetical protein